MVFLKGAGKPAPFLFAVIGGFDAASSSIFPPDPSWCDDGPSLSLQDHSPGYFYPHFVSFFLVLLPILCYIHIKLINILIIRR